ncbi:MAG: hypothetical protein D6689_16600 [Deltaproteobacteria bacterium]|nr:MAG: hypothetical protein D6689_16600 [Deltaproteobacteria bacterium]
MSAIGRIACALSLAAAVFAACGGNRRRAPAALPATRAPAGECGDPRRHGALGDAPRIERYDRDLDGDGRDEIVATDRSLCTADGNCFWNVFVGDPACPHYAGTIAGAALETGDPRGDGGMRDVRAWWRLTGGGRLLLEHYRYHRGRYQVIDALLCRREGDDRIQCAPSLRRQSDTLR